MTTADTAWSLVDHYMARRTGCDMFVFGVDIDPGRGCQNLRLTPRQSQSFLTDVIVFSSPAPLQVLFTQDYQKHQASAVSGDQ